MEETAPNPYAATPVPELYRLLKKDGTLTLEQIDQIQNVAFPDGEDKIDFEDDNAAKMFGQLKKARTDATERRDAMIEDAVEKARTVAREYLVSIGGVDAAKVPDHVLDEISKSLALAAAQEALTPEERVELEPVIVVQRDDDTMTLMTESGEVLGFVDAPHAELDRRLILEWVGERLTKINARKAGLEAEKAFWLNKITKIYDPQINKQARAAKAIDYVYSDIAKFYLDEFRESAEKRKMKVPNSMKVGLLEIGYRKDTARVDVLDEAKGIVWLKVHCPDAVKTTESIGKSLIPVPVKALLTEDIKNETGIFFYTGGNPQFKMG